MLTPDQAERLNAAKREEARADDRWLAASKELRDAMTAVEQSRNATMDLLAAVRHRTYECTSGGRVMLYKTVVEIETTSGDWAEIAEFGAGDQESANLRAVAWGERLLGGFRTDRRPRVQIVDGEGNWLGSWFNDRGAQEDPALAATGRARGNAGSE